MLPTMRQSVAEPLRFVFNISLAVQSGRRLPRQSSTMQLHCLNTLPIQSIRKLAEESQRSVQQIFNVIQHVQQDTTQAVAIMATVTDEVQQGLQVSDAAITKFQAIEQSMAVITPRMAEVSNAASSISAGVQEVAATTEEFVASAERNAAHVENVAASSEEQLASMQEITASAQTLAQMSDELHALINQFKK